MCGGSIDPLDSVVPRPLTMTRVSMGLRLGFVYGLVLSFPVFSRYYSELLPLRTIAVMGIQSGTHKLHVSPDF